MTDNAIAITEKLFDIVHNAKLKYGSLVLYRSTNEPLYPEEIEFIDSYGFLTTQYATLSHIEIYIYKL